MARVLPDGCVLGGRYRIEMALGDGATGTVYRAKHVKFTRHFAIKVLHPNLMTSVKTIQRFEREAELAGRLRHQNVASVVDVGVTADGLRYMVMELAPGVPLSMLIDGPLGEARVVDLAKQLCLGLQHAHEGGLIHRDLKPDNVIVEPRNGGREIARIVDWGVAILREDVSDAEVERLTTKGIVVGTPHYMAPEQASGDVIDHRADIFALGLICYEALTGTMPFDGSGVDVARANVQKPTPPMRERAPSVTVEPILEAIVHRMLEKDPADRPGSATAVHDLLELYERDRAACAQLMGVEGRYQIATEEIARRADRRPLVLLLLGLTACGLLAWLAVRRSGSTTHPPPVAMPIAGDASVAIAEDAAVVASTVAPDVGPPVVTITRAPRRAPSGAAPTSPPASPSATMTPTVDELADLYATVGRALRDLENRKGMAATIDLWPRYRWIRFNDALTTPERRAKAFDLLARLQRDIGTVN